MIKIPRNRDKKGLPLHDESTYDNPTSNITDKSSGIFPKIVKETRMPFMPLPVPISLEVLAKANGAQDRDGSDFRRVRNRKEVLFREIVYINIFQFLSQSFYD